MTIGGDRVDQILQRILEAIKPDQGPDGFDDIILALEQALSFQMALMCADCRRRYARQLRANIPAMLTAAARLQREAQEEHAEQHLH